MNNSFLINAMVFLAAALIFVPFAKKLGLSSVLGYLIAGIVIGPFVLGFVGQEGEDLMHAAEFGVVMMLFLVGLELEPKKFWAMRKTVVGMGVMQMLLTVGLLISFFILIGWQWQLALAVSLAFAMSSTAIVLQSLKEKGLSKSVAGESSFSVLLFQDISVIPILALMPLLVINPNTTGAGHTSFISHYSGHIQAIIVVGAVGFVHLAGLYLIVPILRQIARTNLRELFTIASLLLIVAIAALMEAVGLSPALGTFLAGVVLANSEFKHELESDIEPFKGLLLGLFFVAVGSTINFQLLYESPSEIAMIVSVVMVIKFIVLFFIGKVFKVSQDQNFLFAFGMSQVGEFAFVLLSFATQIQIFDTATSGKLMAVTAITMMLTPLILLLNEKLIAPNFGVKEKVLNDVADEIDQKHKVIIAGFGHFGSTIGRILRAAGVEATILDNDSERVELLRKMGFKVYYGDATRMDLLKSAGADEALLFIAAIDSPAANLDIIKKMSKQYPKMKILSRARNRYDAHVLMDLGINHIYRETLYTAVHLGTEALAQLGYRKYSAARLGQKFIQYDEAALKKLSASRNNKDEYAFNAKKEIEQQEQLLQNDLNQNLNSADHSWDSNYMRIALNVKND